MTTDDKPRATIMVVDDQPANLKLLEEMLSREGYRVRSFPRGRLALAAALRDPPEAILLDINMPEMNGYEVCQQLKSDAQLRQIPVIFLSALNETGDKVRAFQCGGVDYITKPFQFDEVRARVETHTKLHQLQRATLEQNQRLEEVVKDRTRELAEANARLKILDGAKTDFLELISHEFRTPLNGLLGVGELVLQESGDSELREMFEQSRRRILTLLEDAMVLTEIEGDAAPCESGQSALEPVLQRALAQARELAQSRYVILAAGTVPAVNLLGREDLLVKALQALLETAVKFASPGETVRVEPSQAADLVQISIESRGRTIPPEAVPKFFDVLSILEPLTPGGDLGLSPAVAHRILSLFGGSLSVENRNCGIAFSICMKSAAACP